MGYTYFKNRSVLHLSVIGRDRQSVIRQRRGEAGGNRRAGDAVGMDVLTVAAQGALVFNGALSAPCHCFSWLRLCLLTFNTRLLSVRAEVCGVQAVPCGDDGAAER